MLTTSAFTYLAQKLKLRKHRWLMRDYSVVAVHGLGGGCYSTWSDQDNLWLAQLLPQVDNFTNAKILTFGYDAKAFTRPYNKASKGRTFTFAEALLSDLADDRDSTEGGKLCPIIFLGHSLGGIVIKSTPRQALRHARERESQFGNILSCTKSVIFFGTPHQGADSATWAGYLSAIGRAVGITTTKITKELMRWSDPLVELTKAFSENQLAISITTFYEVYETHGIIVVPEASATIGWGGERCISLEADHSQLCKFSEGTDKWDRVQKRLRIVARDAIATLSPPQGEVEGVMNQELQDRLTALRS
ncbi:unnamed protein product [Clonostachys rosea]|uniref:DUF676 domain-containing protein n=1 Tax=Bionectria ochroleuca TaxID=29856 RepID=A0ABY6UD67_BIOOC|nr:unnamed protein product [Clonostachys rosea]